MCVVRAPPARLLQDQESDGKQGDSEAAEMELDMDCEDGKMGGSAGDNAQQELEEAMAEAADKLAEDLTDKFKEEMEPIVESVEAAMEHFGDLDELLDGPKGWDLSHGMWQESGWREFQDLRKKLEDLRELRDLVRSPCSLFAVPDIHALLSFMWLGSCEVLCVSVFVASRLSSG